jgi:hypothetical protein
VIIQPSVWLDRALGQLLSVTLSHESAMSARDAEILQIQQKYNPAINTGSALISDITAEIEAFYRANSSELTPEGEKSVQVTYGLVGLRAPANPALLPLSDKWDWEKIAAKLKLEFGKRFFHAPKPPAIDKVKVKKTLSPAELTKVGMRLDDAESFFVELNRLAPADEVVRAA